MVAKLGALPIKAARTDKRRRPGWRIERMELFFVLLIILVASRMLGEAAERLGQPALVGELISGIALGAIVAHYPTALPALHRLSDNNVFSAITDLAMFFLMLFAGVEMQPHKLLQYSAGAISVAIGGMIVPLALGIFLGFAFIPASDAQFAQSLFLGTALAITAIPATVRILVDLGKLDTPVGQTIVSAALFDDVLSLILLAFLTGLLSTGGAPEWIDLAILLSKSMAFFAIAWVVGAYLFPWGGKFFYKLKAQELELTAMLVGAFAFSILADLLGLHFVVGAFVAGLFFGQTTINIRSYTKVHDTLSAMTFGFLAPIFFASIGLHFSLTALIEAPVFVILLVTFAFFGKILGAGAAARSFGFSASDARAIGIGMSPRGAVELVIASVALKAGLFEQGPGGSPVLSNMFSAVVFMAIITTVISPILLKLTFGHSRRKGA